MKEKRDFSAGEDKLSSTILIHYCVLYSKEWSSSAVEKDLVVKAEVVLLGLTGKHFLML